MERIYFIDNNLRQTCKVIEALKIYFKEQTGRELESKMILINMNQIISQDTISYYKDVFNQINTDLNECKTEKEIKEAIAQISKEGTLVVVDLHMVDGEEKDIEENMDYKCISMKCMEDLEKAGVSYVWYSSYAGNVFKEHWQTRFQTLYKREIPKIYERKTLVQGNFSRENAKEILGV
ncbi:MAG: hypothetical protein K2N73_07675 [Lachnospiraceae bacterium]|nr:hypothetical protein [Lachnospiraceae bacterium]